MLGRGGSAPAVCRRGNPRGPSERTAASIHSLELCETAACTGTIPSSCIIDPAGERLSPQSGRVPFFTGIFDVKHYPAHTALLSPLETERNQPLAWTLRLELMASI